MIENSNNDSATDLYDEDNGPEGIDDANSVFGLCQTTIGTDGYWGLTTTTVDDQIRLLRQVFANLSAMPPDGRRNRQVSTYGHGRAALALCFGLTYVACRPKATVRRSKAA